MGLLPENELSRSAGVELSPVTKGAVVNESLETSVPGVFACGNVLHVHDLVDFVTQEAAVAGAHASEFAGGGLSNNGCDIAVLAKGGVRYTVPQVINPIRMPEKLTVRFRVAGVFEDRWVNVWVDGTRLVHRRRPILVPGEMEDVVLTRDELLACGNVESIVVCLEEASS